MCGVYFNVCLKRNVKFGRDKLIRLARTDLTKKVANTRIVLARYPCFVEENLHRSIAAVIKLIVLLVYGAVKSTFAW